MKDGEKTVLVRVPVTFSPGTASGTLDFLATSYREDGTMIAQGEAHYDVDLSEPEPAPEVEPVTLGGYL